MERIRDALWSRPGSGASVMVGSGFSRCALKVRPGAADSPLWQDLATEVAGRLYPSGSADDGPAGDTAPDFTGDFLRTAQEYETAFGRTDLHRFLQQQTRDEDFAPGEMHEQLLRLPWRDVFTTNWDTLLERACSRVFERRYDSVENTDQIPLANQPRLVKLHGSLPAQLPLIFTEEGYRTYPTQFPHFVNTVQQAMMESVFCLIVFSGNDPNFLHWSGWVRDHLGKKAPKIYLAGWLRLSPHRRAMLEDRGVVPIDLANHPQARKWPDQLQHRYAVEWVLYTLERGQPYDATGWPSHRPVWNSNVPDYLQPVAESTSELPEPESVTSQERGTGSPIELFRETLKVWKKNRLLYPGWLVFPIGEQRENISWRTDDWERQFLNVMPDLSLPERLEFIHELVWRREILLQPISSELEGAADSTLQAIDCPNRTIEESPNGQINWIDAREAWRNVASALLTDARYRHDSALFSQRIGSLQPYSNDSADVYHRVRHELCLWAVNSLDFRALDSHLAEWAMENCDPAWMVRKAALLRESGRYDEAHDLTGKALDSIRTFMPNNRDIAGASREGWTLCSALTVQNWPMFQKRWDELSRLKCDSWAEKDLIHRRLNRDTETRESPNFNIGTRRQNRITFTTASPWRAAFRAIRLSEVAGLPPSTGTAKSLGVDVSGQMLRSAAVNISHSSPEFAIRLILRTCTYDKDPALESVLTRTRLALLPHELAKDLAENCIALIEFGLRKDWIEQTRVAIEVLSRLVLRLEANQTLEIFKRAITYYSDRQSRILSHPWLSEPVSNLMKRSWDAFSPDLRSERILDILGSPIVGLDGFDVQIEAHHPDPGNLLDGGSRDLRTERHAKNEESWQSVCSYLTRALVAGGEARRRAAKRLSHLISNSCLTQDEISRIGQALWAGQHTPEDGLPIGTDLHDWAFLVYPEPEAGMAEKRFRLKWFSTLPKSSPDTGTQEGDSVAFTFGYQPDNQSSLEDTIWNVGAALSVCAGRGRPFVLTDDDPKRIVDLLTVWADEDAYPRQAPFMPGGVSQPTLLAIDGITWILKFLEIPEEVGERLYLKLKNLTEAGIPALKPIGELARIVPSRRGEMTSWLRSAVASEDRDVVVSALSSMVSWIREADEGTSGEWQPPSDVFREVGMIIATRREVALPSALEVAATVFSEGTDEIRESVREHAL